MGESVSKALKASPGFRSLRVPTGFEGGIGTERRVVNDSLVRVRGADEDAVTGQAAQYRSLIDEAKANAETIRKKFDATGKKSLLPDQEAEVLSAYDSLADTIRLYQRDIDRGEPVVVASLVDALMSADAPTRDMILRRAGNPAAFEPLRGAELDAVPNPDVDASRGTATQTASEATAAERAAAKHAASQYARPRQFRLSSQFSEPDYLGEDGIVRSGAEKWTEMRVSDVDDATRDISSLSDSSKKQLLERLVGDQIGQVKAIENRTLNEMGLDEDAVKALSPQQRGALLGLINDDGTPRQGVGPARLPSVDDKTPNTKNTVTVGTGERWGGGGPGRADRSTDSVAMSTSRSQRTRVLEDMYRRTLSASVDPQSGQPTSPFVDKGAFGDLSNYLDKYFPWWRSRFAELDDSGKIAYPARAPTPEFIVGMVHTMYGVTDDAFDQRMIPLIKDALEQASDVPATDKAREFAERVFLPSKRWEKQMQQGVGSPHYPTQIYSDRPMNRSQVETPERHPYGNNAVGKPLSQPGSGDSASISRMPPNSPMRLLLA